MIRDIKIEICCGTIDDCLVASNYPIDRIELNCALELGGLTPSVSTLLMAKEKVRQPICCMVRPRTAGFVYSETEIENMMMDARALLEAKADGIVFGFIHKDHTIDKESTLKMVKLIHSYGKEAIFHKAFDECEDLFKACETLIECNIDRILTGGGKCAIQEGSKVIGQLQDQFGDKIELLVGGGITPNNITSIAKTCHTSQLHMTAKQTYFDDGEYVAVDHATLKKALENLYEEN